MKNPSAPHFYFDVDNTLIHLLKPSDISNSVFNVDAPFSNLIDELYGKYYLCFNKQMLELLLASHNRGHIIVLWSAGGAEWAREVADRIEKLYGPCIDFCLSKPSWWADDKTSDHVLPDVNRVIPTVPKGAL